MPEPVLPEPVVPEPVVPEPVAEAAPGAAPAVGRRRSGRGIALGAGAVVLAGALVGGYLVFRGDDGGGSSGARAASSPTAAATGRSFGVRADGAHYGDLRQALLPIPSGYEPGADLKQYGNDGVLDVKETEGLLTGDTSALSAALRKKATALATGLHAKGAAFRTYRTEDGTIAVQLEVIQVGDRQAAKEQGDRLRAAAAKNGFLRKGPAVEGHPEAICVRSDSEPDDHPDSAVGSDPAYAGIGLMTCEATEGDLMLNAHVSGPLPFKQQSTELVAGQLDRIDATGSAV
ncbi:hypothetical protein [Streptomyces sp. CA-111067]|uniref:hypothetical protein n=1 Tax=Streptomyces sp. CA-111067 TaxID=3240046 RepID=UPI003D97C101